MTFPMSFMEAGAGVLDRLRDSGAGLGLRHLFWQIGCNDCDLVTLLLRQLGTPALLIKYNRFLALLDHLLQQRLELVVTERCLALTTRLDVRVLERRIDKPQR